MEKTKFLEPFSFRRLLEQQEHLPSWKAGHRPVRLSQQGPALQPQPAQPSLLEAELQPEKSRTEYTKQTDAQELERATNLLEKRKSIQQVKAVIGSDVNIKDNSLKEQAVPISSGLMAQAATLPQQFSQTAATGRSTPTPKKARPLPDWLSDKAAIVSPIPVAKISEKPSAGRKERTENTSLQQLPGKKQRVSTKRADQIIDHLTDLTAVGGVIMKEKEANLLTRPEVESQNTQAVRKIPQEEEEKLFLAWCESELSRLNAPKFWCSTYVSPDFSKWP